jgi:glycosyltransferase involved in cell wall biosynthesis
MKIALIHDWLVFLGGSEKVLEAIYEIFPGPIFTLVADIDSLDGSILKRAEIFTSFIEKLPLAKKKYRSYLPLFPIAIEQFDLSEYDIIISVSSSVAKGILKRSDQLHISYCCTPIRYAWDLYHQYIIESGLNKGLKSLLAKLILHYIRIWDQTTMNRVDYFITLSNYVAERIEKTYGKDSTVIYPPVEVEKFEIETKKEDFYLTASRLVPYKKIDLIVETFNKIPARKLVVIGDGPEYNKIKRKASKNIELLGYQPFVSLKYYLQKAKAFIFMADEDFGILPVEAQACGTPVIAYGKGGVVETVVPFNNHNLQINNLGYPKPTGIFFYKQTIDALIEAIKLFERIESRFDYTEIRKNAMRFSKDRFVKEFKEFVDEKKKYYFK